MGRAIVLAVALLAGALVPAAPASAAACTGPDFGKLLRCLSLGQPPTSELTLGGPVALDVPLDQNLPLRQTRETFARTNLVVKVPKGVTTGAGGTVLLILAGGRLLAADAAVTRLDRNTVDALRAFGACADRLCDVVGGQGTVSGKELVDGRLAGDLATQAVTVGPSAPGEKEKPASAPADGKDADDDGGGFFNGLTLLLIAIAIGLAGVLAFGARRRFTAVESTAVPAAAPPPTRQDVPAANRQAPPPTIPMSGHRVHRVDVQPSGRRRRATVRTDLHPQGYVELDRDLYRAAWADPDTAPPREGHPVDVVRDPDSDVLLAYPPG